MEAIEQLDLYIDPTKINKRFKALNDGDKNLVIELGLKLLDKGCKDYQILKNDEWSEKLEALEENKNKNIENLREELRRREMQMERCKRITVRN